MTWSWRERRASTEWLGQMIYCGQPIREHLKGEEKQIIRSSLSFHLITNSSRVFYDYNKKLLFAAEVVFPARNRWCAPQCCLCSIKVFNFLLGINPWKIMYFFSTLFQLLITLVIKDSQLRTFCFLHIIYNTPQCFSCSSFCHHHACFGASSHVNDVVWMVASSICHVCHMFLVVLSKFQTFCGIITW